MFHFINEHELYILIIIIIIVDLNESWGIVTLVLGKTGLKK